ncbi:hypothetical protein HJC23_007713 [Cyclotella cryptica]|uniref:Uncharacterized protein n=1 Tax=Cyclotella cryptica TaxID=29204 RepID=A0ABD3P8W2_9STRA
MQQGISLGWTSILMKIKKQMHNYGSFSPRIMDPRVKKKTRSGSESSRTSAQMMIDMDNSRIKHIRSNLQIKYHRGHLKLSSARLTNLPRQL